MAIVTRAGSLFIWRRGFTIAGPTAGSFSQAGGILLVLPVTRLHLTPPVSQAKRHLHATALHHLGCVFQLVGRSQLFFRVSLLIKWKKKNNKNPGMLLGSQGMEEVGGN